MFSNKNLNEVLLPEISNFDYVIQVQGKYTEEEMSALMNGIKQFPEVLMTAEIPLKKIKSKDRLVYREEKTIQKPVIRKRFK